MLFVLEGLFDNSPAINRWAIIKSPYRDNQSLIALATKSLEESKSKRSERQERWDVERYSSLIQLVKISVLLLNFGTTEHDIR